MLTKLIRYLYYILFFATPLLMFSKTSEIFEFNKMIFIYIMAILIGGIWTIKWIKQVDKKLEFCYIHWLFLFFLATQILSTIFSIDIHTSIFGYYGRFNGGLISIIAYMTLFFVFTSEATKKVIENVLKASVLSSVIVMLWGMPGKLGYDLSCWLFTGTLSNECWTNQFNPQERLFSTLGQPNWLGAYLAIHIFIGLYFYLKHAFNKEQRSNYSILYLIYIVFTFICLLFTRSKSAVIAAGTGFSLLPVFIIFLKDKTFIVTTLKKYVIFGVLFALSIFFFKTGAAQIDRYFTVDIFASQSAQPVTQQTQPQNLNITDSFDIRKIVWKGAWDLGLRYPLFGTGVETFAYSYYFTRPLQHNTTSEWDFLYNKAHNEFLNYLATTGFIGLAAYLAMIIGVFILFFQRYFDKSLNTELQDKLLLLCCFLAYCTILITNFSGFSTSTINLFFYLLPAVFAAKFIDKSDKKFHSINIYQGIGILIVALGMGYSILFMASYWFNDIRYAKADGYIRSGRYTEAAYDLIDILKYHYEHVYENKLSLAAVGTALNTSDKDEIQQLVTLAEYYNEKSLQASPKNLLYWRTRGNMYFNIYQATADKAYLDQAITASQITEQLAPTDPRMPYTTALFAVQRLAEEKGNRVKYQSLIEKNIDRATLLKPDYIEVYTLKASYLTQIGNKEQAIKTYEYILKTFDPNNQEMKQTIKELQESN